MKVSESWLREWVNPALSTEELVAQITMAGLEVDAVEPVAEAFDGVVIGEIVAVEAHPDAEKLRVCRVRADGDEQQVVCGAPNARTGLKAPFARVGASLPGGMKIKKAKLRGVESFGMLCGASELGLEDELDGLMELPDDAPTGEDFRVWLALDDSVIDVDLTPNRGDCLSVLGLARELAVLNDMPMKMPAMEAVGAETDTVVPVRIEAEQDCPVYVGRVVEGVDISCTTPVWMQEKLRRSGIRSIDVVVDVTNYVMLELGQPMHAFDKATLQGGIVVRKARDGEKLQLLDGQELVLKADALVIADQSRALALAGIMGGEDAGVSETTRDIVLESAFFAPRELAGRARSYGLHTDSSHRFERGVDWQGQERAIERATSLLLAIAGGKPGPVHKVESKTVPQIQAVTLNEAKLQQVLGIALPKADVTTLLGRLGLTVTETGSGWQCGIPSSRFDLAIEADLVEEVARIYGYDRLPTRTLSVPMGFREHPESRLSVRHARDHLVSAGYHEAITYSFIDPAVHRLFSDLEPVMVQNPIASDMAAMRTSLLPGLVQAMQYNRNRQQARVRLFETGLRFVRQNGELRQQPGIAAVICGNREQELWANDQQPVDFYDIKGDVENLLAVCGQSRLTFAPLRDKALHPGQSAAIMDGDEIVGMVGAIHPQIAKKLSITGPVFAFELSLSRLLSKNVPEFKALSKFPNVRRDLSIVLDTTITADAATQLIKAKAGPLLQHCSVFDVYQGQGIEAGKKSIAIGMVFQHAERSLNDEEIQGLIDGIVDALQTKLGASLRI